MIQGSFPPALIISFVCIDIADTTTEGKASTIDLSLSKPYREYVFILIPNQSIIFHLALANDTRSVHLLLDGFVLLPNDQIHC